MANLICTLYGARGRSIKIYDNKCEIITDVTLGSVLTSNATDGKKTIFYKDCTGVQFKESGLTIGFLQLETPSGQMNNVSSNFFSENTFTFDGGVGNSLMEDVYTYITDRIEGYKYNDNDLLEANLPRSLADKYGKPRPPLKREIEQAAANQKEIAAKKEAEKQQRIAEIAEQAKTGKYDEPILKFLTSIEGANRYRDILTEWEAQGLNNNPKYADIDQEIQKNATVERLYGPVHNQSKIDEFILEMKRQLGMSS